MLFNKLIISIALCVSFHSAIISMENEINEQIKRINQFTEDIMPSMQDIKPLGHWLTQKRNISSYATWDNLINTLISKIIFKNGDQRWQSKSKPAIKIVIQEIARYLQPGEDCSHELAIRATKAVEEAVEEYMKLHVFRVKTSS